MAALLPNIVKYGAALAGQSIYVQPTDAPSLGDSSVEVMRHAFAGGQLSPLTATSVRWYQADIESALNCADGGYMDLPGQLWKACKTDATVRGVLSTRTQGLVRLPLQYQGNQEMIDILSAGKRSVRSLFDAMAPPAELAAIADDGIGLGIGVGEMVEVKGRSFPQFTRLEPEHLVWRQSESRWYYRSIAGLLPITPGDGKWVLHIPGGAVHPWQAGIYPAVGKAYITKLHASAFADNWRAKLANPARVAVNPQGSSEGVKQSWFQAVLAWGIDTVFGMPPGYDVKIVESNGRGAESFETAQDRADREIAVAIAGQVVTTDGGSGFQNNDIHASIRADLIQSTADGLAYTINTQILPRWILERFGEPGFNHPVTVKWDITPPGDRKGFADANSAVASSISSLTDSLKPYNMVPDVELMLARAGIPWNVAPEVEEETVIEPEVEETDSEPEENDVSEE